MFSWLARANLRLKYVEAKTTMSAGKQKWVYIRVLFYCIVLILVGYYFLPESYGLLWHAYHGKVAHVKSMHGGSYVVPVPLLQTASLDDTGWDLSVVREAGRARARLVENEKATMTFSGSSQGITGDRVKGHQTAFLKKIGVTRTQVALLNSAGQETYCYEERTTLTQTGENTTMVRCIPMTDQRGFSAYYMGTTGGVLNFIDIVKNIQRGK